VDGLLETATPSPEFSSAVLSLPASPSSVKLLSESNNTSSCGRLPVAILGDKGDVLVGEAGFWGETGWWFVEVWLSGSGGEVEGRIEGGDVGDCGCFVGERGGGFVVFVCCCCGFGGKVTVAEACVCGKITAWFVCEGAEGGGG